MRSKHKQSYIYFSPRIQWDGGKYTQLLNNLISSFKLITRRRNIVLRHYVRDIAHNIRNIAPWTEELNAAQSTRAV